MAMGGSSPAEIPTVLAATVLRFQCVELEEKEREDELHAFQSGEERAGDASERLALEQLRFLFQNRNELVRAESGVEAEKLKSGKNLKLKSKPEPFLHEPQKRFGTPAGFNRALVTSGAARRGSPPAKDKRSVLWWGVVDGDRGRAGARVDLAELSIAKQGRRGRVGVGGRLCYK
jgi:hypothetical protein